VELPADVSVLPGRLTDELVARGGLVGIYLYGSLATGDFSPAGMALHGPRRGAGAGRKTCPRSRTMARSAEISEQPRSDNR
jgi:hypothetical protein